MFRGSSFRCGCTQALWQGHERPLCLLPSHLHPSLHFSALSPSRRSKLSLTAGFLLVARRDGQASTPQPPPLNNLSRRTSFPLAPPYGTHSARGPVPCRRACRTHPGPGGRRLLLSRLSPHPTPTPHQAARGARDRGGVLTTLTVGVDFY